MGIKTREMLNVDGSHYAWLIWCPACDSPHHFDPRWTFNGDHERPTFRASMLVRGVDGAQETVCHSFLTDGEWQFLEDCTHASKGQRVPVPDWSTTRYAGMRSDGVVPAPEGE